MLLFFTSILALLQLLEGRRAVSCFSPACSTPFPCFGNDLLLPKSKLSFPVAQFSRSGLWSCFSWVPDRAAGTAHPISSSSSPLLSCTHPAELKTVHHMLLMPAKPSPQTNQASAWVSGTQAASCTCCFRMQILHLHPWVLHKLSGNCCAPLSPPFYSIVVFSDRIKLFWDSPQWSQGDVVLSGEGDDAVLAPASPLAWSCLPSIEKFSTERATLLDLFIFAHVCGLRCVLRKRLCCLKALYF